MTKSDQTKIVQNLETNVLAINFSCMIMTEQSNA